MKVYAIYAVAALAEIVGCFCFWAWMRMGKPLWLLVPGMISLAIFAWALTFVPVEAAGRAYAAYGGIYIVASLIWLRFVDGVSPDGYDIAGGAICLLGASVILFAPRG